MAIDIARNVYSEMCQVDFESYGYDDQHEYLIEVLEIMAVGAGLKPAFLGGQSLLSHSEDLLAELGRIAQRHGLLVLRTPGLGLHVEVASFKDSTADRGFLDFLLSHYDEQPDDDEVLWIYRQPALEKQIAVCLSGEIPSCQVLGYPSCCTDWHLRFLAAQMETRLRSYAVDFGATSTDDLIGLYERATPTSDHFLDEIDRAQEVMAEQRDESRSIYPFVHFTACPLCTASELSPGARTNEQMKQLAFTVDPSFAMRLEEMADSYGFF